MAGHKRQHRPAKKAIRQPEIRAKDRIILWANNTASAGKNLPGSGHGRIGVLTGQEQAPPRPV